MVPSRRAFLFLLLARQSAARALQTPVGARVLGRCPRVECCQAGDKQAGLFASLVSASCPTAAVALGTAEESGRGLVATRDASAGDVLLTIPKSVLITAHRSGVVGGLHGQTELTWETAGDLREEVGEENFKLGATWDVRLALGVFEACAGGSGGDFWDAYRRLLPPPPRIAHPLTLPDALLDEVQDEALVARTRALRGRLHDLYPELHDHSCHPVTAAYERMGAPMEQVPRPLPYAYALVVSRCFAMGDGDTFAFVPWLDMANHDAAPAANFASDKRGFVLRALTPIAKGDEVSVCYGEEYTSARLFEQYGFVPCNGTAQDARWLAALVDEARAADAAAVDAALDGAPSTALGDSVAGMQALAAAFDAHATTSERAHLATSERRAALFDALVPPDDPRPPSPSDDDTADADDAPAAPHPAALLAAVRWKLGDFGTSLREDEETMAELCAADGADARTVAVLEYRLARKRLLTFIEDVLSTFLGV
jgi:hypothetical protein